MLIKQLILSSLLFLLSTSLFADPPTRVIRLSKIEGEVSFLPAGVKQWAPAYVNRPLYKGDNLWNDINSFSALQLNNAKICLGSDTNTKIVNLTNQLAQFQLNQGSMNLTVKSMRKNQKIEIDTPNLALVIKQPGFYRISVDSEAFTTTINVRNGQATAFNKRSSFIVRARQTVQFTGTQLKATLLTKAPKNNALDNWCQPKTVVKKERVTIRYVSEEVIGCDDLDEYGTWQDIDGYGHGWTPRGVSANWSPYREGRWLWIKPWGWTWVGNEPWGFTPYHYGRWVSTGHRWYWIPGPRQARPVYAPALVVFVSTRQNDVGWFPLGPGEVYRPTYRVSKEYFHQTNISNTTINNIVVQNAYQQPQQKTVTYKNQQHQHVTAVPVKVFQQAQPVNQALVSVSKEEIETGSVTQVVEVAPQPISISGSTTEAKAKPSQKVEQSQAVAVTSEPAASVEPTPSEIENPQPAAVAEEKPAAAIEQPVKQAEQELAKQPEEQQKPVLVEPTEAPVERTVEKVVEQSEVPESQASVIQEPKQQSNAEDMKQNAAVEAQQRAADEAKQRGAEEAQQRAAEEAQQRAAEEAQQRAAEEAQQRAAEEAQQRAAEEAQQRAAEEAQQRADEKAQQRAAEEAQQRAAEEAQQRAAEEAQQRAAEEAQQ